MENWQWNIFSEKYLENTISRCREKNIILPKFSELKNPETIDENIVRRLSEIDREEIHPLNLFRINWKNEVNGSGFDQINFLEIPKAITNVNARIIGLVGKHFPTGAHKVGATYGCLTPYLITGRFNPDYHKAVWPSTGNYCRGGVFNSNLLGVKSVAILPEEMSRERFEWLKSLGAEIYATPGCESNVKEIYDKCHDLEAQSDEYMIFNQFDQFGNSIWHYEVTGSAFEELFDNIKKGDQRFSAYISATGSAGTLGAGDYLKQIYPHCKLVAVEALQCPTLLMNGFGGHRIEGIGDKHVPWIHNVKNTDAVSAIDDEDTIRLMRLFNEETGHETLEELGVDELFIKHAGDLGISSICNLLAAIKTAKYYEFNSNDIIFTVFTDSMGLYQSRMQEMNENHGSYTKKQAYADWQSLLVKQGIDYFSELSYYQKKAIHNLKYFTWVEQQGKTAEELNAQWYDEHYWQSKFNIVPQWDKLIDEFNKEVGL